MTKRQAEATRKNFDQYCLAGMISNLHRIYYERRKQSDETLTKLGLAIDTLEELRLQLKMEDL